MKSLDELNKDFGTFYPTGHMVVGFQEASDAHKVLRELQAQERQTFDAMLVHPQQMVAFAEKNINEAGFIANLGTSLTTVQHFLDAAKAGATFLVVSTPDDATAERVSAAIHHAPFVMAERYHRLAIETVH